MLSLGRSTMRRLHPGASFLLLILGVTLAGCYGPRREISEGVQIILSTGELEPTSTFEVRFQEPVVSQNEVGMPNATSPLIVHPPLKGKFHWLSQRSGLFIPTELMPLATTYTITLRPGFQPSLALQGELAAVPGAKKPSMQLRLRRVFHTPPFSVVNYGIDSSNPGNAYSEPVIHMQFNALVHTNDLQRFVEFRNESNQVIKAEIRHANDEDQFWSWQDPGLSRLTWKERFDPNAPSSSVYSEPGMDVSIFLNRVVVTPAQALFPAKAWKLILRPGLSSPETPSRIPELFEVKVGQVRPFMVDNASAENNLGAGKSIRLLLSKQIDPEITSSNIHQWLSISPVPSNLVSRVEQSAMVVVTGAFKLHQPYTVLLREGLPAAEAFTLDYTYSNRLTFLPIPPRLYFPSFSRDQLSEGRREIELLTINIPQVNLSAKLLDRHSLIHALRGYHSYYKGYYGYFNQGSSYEPYSGLDYNLIPGTTIFAQTIASNNLTDTAQITKLRWNDILGPRHYGAVLLQAERQAEGEFRTKLGTQTLLQLTDLGITWKRSDDQLLAWVFSYASGNPVTNAAVSLMSRENEALLEGHTDAQGLVRFPVREKGEWLLAESGQDLHAVDLNKHNLGLYRFRIPLDYWSEGQQAFRLMLFSDRNVYQPGETFHLKAIGRQWDGTAWQIPKTNAAGALRVFDAKGQKFFETNLSLSDVGSFAQSIPLPLGVLGQYRATWSVTNDLQWTHYFSVQEYKPNTFEISLKTKTAFAPDEKLEIPVSAKYFMGKNLSRAKVKWSLDASDYFAANDEMMGWEGLDHFMFGTSVDYTLGRHPSSLDLDGEGQLTDKTNFVIVPEIPINPVAPAPRRVHLLVEITDLNQQTLSQSARFIRHSSDFYLGVLRLPEVLRARKAFPVPIIAVARDGTPLPGGKQVKVTIQRIDYQTIRMKSAGRAVRFKTEFTLTNILQQEVLTCNALKDADQWVLDPAATNALPQITLPTAGTYLIESKTQDSGGRDVITAFTFSVSGEDALAWDYRDEVRLELIPDRATYKPGDIAKLLLKSPLPGRALVTVERENVLRSFLTELRGNAPQLEIPLRTEDAPNVFVSVVLVRGHENSPRQIKMPEYRLGYCQLQVENPTSKLQVDVQLSDESYRPADQVQVLTEVRSASSKPVKGAEVTLYAVDEGVLSLTGYANPDPYTFFNTTRPLRVKTGMSLLNLMPEDPEDLVFNNKGYLIGGGGELGRRVRKNFLPCAFWSANLRTDSDGKIKTQFTAPDGLTRYRVIAVAHSMASQFGSGQAAFEINKPLMLEPALPRFANVTDQFIARAVVHNQTDQAGEIEVELALDKKAVLAPPGTPALKTVTRKLSLPARGSGRVEFTLDAVEAGTAKWIWKAHFVNGSPEVANFTDAVESTLNIGYVTPLLREILVERLNKPEANILARANPLLLEGTGTVTVRISNTRLSELSETVSHLLHYPYGCVEQTSSSMLPWLAMSEFSRWRSALPQLNVSPEKTAQAIRTGVTRLLSMQTQSGGLSYWPGGYEPMLWGSAYGGMVLVLAKRQGAEVPAARLDSLTSYLSQQLRDSEQSSSQAPDFERCLALYTLALASRAEPSYHEIFYRKRQFLSPENRALLALAILESKGPSAMVEELLSNKTPVVRTTETDWFGCPARELALRLLATVRHKPESTEVDTMVSELLRAQTDAHWGTTQGNGWGLLAMAEYISRVENLGQTGTASLTWGQRSETVDLGTLPKTLEYSFPTSRERATLPLLLANPSGKNLFGQVKIEARPQSFLQPRQDRGYLLKRSYQYLDDDGSVHELKTLKVGDRVLVTLEVEVRQTAHYVAIDDPLPCLFEAINPQFKSQQVAGASNVAQEWFSDFRELRTDRALFFRNHLSQGRYTIRYVARVRAAGKATAPPAKIEEMYHPERFGLSETLQITSLPLESQ